MNAAAGDQSDPRLRQSKDRVHGGNDDVAGQRRFEAAAHRHPVDRCDQRLVEIEALRQPGKAGRRTRPAPPGEALNAAKRWAEQILECSPMAIRASKQSVYRSLDEPTLQAAMTTTYPAVKANLESQNYIEGPRAFAERRKPNWQNR